LFLEARDAFLAVVALPCFPSELLRDGPQLGRLLAEPHRRRPRQLLELATSLAALS